jgi:hypothetical protein
MAVAFRASATSTGSTITVPGTAQAGDWAVLLEMACDTVGVSRAVPSGWSDSGFDATFNTGPSGTPQATWQASTKILTSGDISASVTGLNGNTTNNKIMLVFSGATPLSGITFGSRSGAANNGDLASQAIAASGGAAPLVVVGFVGVNDAAATFSTASPSFDAQVSVGNIRAGYKVYTSSPADHTIDKTDQGQRNFMGGFYVQLRETGVLTPSLFTASGAFYGPTVAQPVQALTAALFTAAGAFYAPTATATRALTPSLFTAAQTFYAPTVGRGARALTPALFTAAGAFYAPTVGRGAVALTPALFTAAQTFYAPTVGRGAVGIVAPLFTSSGAFYGPTVRSPYALTAARFDAGQSFYAATVGRGAVGLTPGLTSFGATFYAATVSAGAADIAPSRFDQESSFFAAQVSAGGALLPALFTDADVFYAPAVTAGAVGIEAARFDEDDTFFGPAVSPAPYPLAPEFFANAAEFFALTISAGGTQDVAPALFTDADIFYGAVVRHGTDTPAGRRLVLGSRRRSVPTDDLSRVVVLGSLDRVVIARPD